MAHEEYLLTKEEVAKQNERNFDWSSRRAVTLLPQIIADQRLSSYFESIKEWTERIRNEHGAPIETMEAIPCQWYWDSNFISVTLRWTSARGTFRREFGVDIKKQGGKEHYVLTTKLPDAAMVI